MELTSLKQVSISFMGRTLAGRAVLLGVCLVVTVSVAQTQNRVPPPIEPLHCSIAAKPRELPNEAFKRRGGRREQHNVLSEGAHLTIKDVAQGRDLTAYERLTLNDPAMFVIQRDQSRVLASARTFLFEHWREHKSAYLVFTGRSVDAVSTSHIFIEKDGAGRWRISWRIVRHTGELDEIPTAYSMEWARPAGYGEPNMPIPNGQTPDAVNDVVELRGKCGEVVMTF